jgi:hypothetical protein
MGTMGEWLAAIGTIGAVAYAITAELRARKREAYGEAAQVIVESWWVEPQFLRLQVSNFSAHPLRSVQLRVDWGVPASGTEVDGTPHRLAYDGNSAVAVLSQVVPGELDAWVDFGRPGVLPKDAVPWVLATWLDRHGRVWSATTGSLPLEERHLPDLPAG